MSDDTNPSQPANETKLHTATLSEPKANPGDKPSKPSGKRKKDKPEPTTAMGKLWYNWVKPIGTVFIAVIVFRAMLLDWNDVPSGSMEPEIHVGDRIAVNRLAYGLQFPLTSPTLDIPFVGRIMDNNPLDGIPTIEWGGGPQRGDIVTFWNPVTQIRMVKRIVAVPGDTIELRGGVMTINGQTASYTDIDPAADGLPETTKLQGTDTALTYESEALLDLTRTVQHTPRTWAADRAVLINPAGQTQQTRGDVVKIQGGGQLLPTEMPLDEFLSRNSGIRVLYRIKDGAPYLNDEPASYNDFAALLLKPYEAGPEADLLNKIGLGVAGHELLIDGQAVFSEQFAFALKERADQLTQAERRSLAERFEPNLRLLRDLLRTNFGPYTVPDDGYLMIGDNRNNSSDGRYFGPVKRSEITGKAFAVAFSFKDNKMLALPPKPAWGRFFKGLD